MLIKVEFASFAIAPDTSTPLIILKETNGPRMLPLPVGPLEASAIAIKTIDVTTEKPLTIDVAKSILEALGGTLTRVIFNPVAGASLSARLEIVSKGTVQYVNCRPSDAIALALRCMAPLYADETAFETIVHPGPRPEREKLRTRIASLDTIEFGSYYPE
jgi:bifunctional DNase/RNase